LCPAVPSDRTPKPSIPIVHPFRLCSLRLFEFSQKDDSTETLQASLGGRACLCATSQLPTNASSADRRSFETERRAQSRAFRSASQVFSGSCPYAAFSGAAPRTIAPTCVRWGIRETFSRRAYGPEASCAQHWPINRDSEALKGVPI